MTIITNETSLAAPTMPLTAVVLLKMNNGVYLKLMDEGSIHAFTSWGEAVEYYEAGYRAAAAATNTGAVSACIDYIMTQPSIIEVDSMEQIYTMIGVPFRPVTMRSDTSVVQAIQVLPDYEYRWDEGTKPRLVSV